MLKKKEIQPKTVEETVKVLGGKKKKIRKSGSFLRYFPGGGDFCLHKFLFQLSVLKLSELRACLCLCSIEALFILAEVRSSLRCCCLITGKGWTGAVCFSCRINAVLLYL